MGLVLSKIDSQSFATEVGNHVGRLGTIAEPYGDANDRDKSFGAWWKRRILADIYWCPRALDLLVDDRSSCRCLVDEIETIIRSSTSNAAVREIGWLRVSLSIFDWNGVGRCIEFNCIESIREARLWQTLQTQLTSIGESTVSGTNSVLLSPSDGHVSSTLWSSFSMSRFCRDRNTYCAWQL